MPIKEQCGVKNPYIGEYGHLQGFNRSFSFDDTCGCTGTKGDFVNYYFISPYKIFQEPRISDLIDLDLF